MFSFDALYAKLVLSAVITGGGYLAFLHIANRLASKGGTPLSRSVLVSIAALRLALGVSARFVVLVALPHVLPLPHRSLVLGLAVFLPIRAGLWYMVLRMFFDREGRRGSLMGRLVAFGVIASYLLDVPAILLRMNILGPIV